MSKGTVIGLDTEAQLRRVRELRTSYTRWLGGRILDFLQTLQGLAAFGLITLGVMVTKHGQARNVVRPLVWRHVGLCGVALLPMLLLLSGVLGIVVIGQTVALTTRVGAQDWIGKVMVTAVVREMGPMLAALVVLSRAGTAVVIELATARASREVEALEVLGIDPIHYLVVPRVYGMALGVFCLTVYAIVAAMISGYLWAFVQEVPIRPGDYFAQLSASLHPLDFLTLGLKSLGLGVLIALITCYHGLAHPLVIEEISRATIRAVTHGVILCVLTDAAFLAVYLIL